MRTLRHSTAVLAAVLLLTSLGLAQDAPKGDAVKPSPSKITGVTVYQNTALVTREVTVPDGVGTLEVIVSPLPPQTLQTSLYAEGTDGTRVLSTRFRTRAIFEDVREEVRKLEAQMKTLTQKGQQLQADLKVLEQNMQLLTKLEAFTGATLQQLTEKGMLSSEQTIALANYVLENRTKRAKEQVGIQQQIQENLEQIAFTKRQLDEKSGGSSKTERDAVIVVDKRNAGPGAVRLNYLVGAASWRPQYKFRAGREKDPVVIEYLAAVEQQTGEDWNGVNLVLSTAQPMLNAAPPDLKALDVAVFRGPTDPTGRDVAGSFGGALPGGPGAPGYPGGGPATAGGGQPQATPQPGMPPSAFAAGGRDRALRELGQRAGQLRGQAVDNWNQKKLEAASRDVNDAAALEQFCDLLLERDEIKKDFADSVAMTRNFANEGPSVTYHLKTRLTLPSRNDEQVLEIARIDLPPEFFYKAVPLLTPNVYRLANLANKSDYVLLPGDATMYIGTDFVGQTKLPLVAIGKQFTVGFGVDPQLQATRVLVDKARTTQGGNQVLKFDYRIYVNSYKATPVTVQVWDRLPHAEASSILVSLTTQSPELSKEPLYVREERPKNLLRWDVKVEPTQNGEKALAIDYQFKMELERTASITALTAK